MFAFYLMRHREEVKNFKNHLNIWPAMHTGGGEGQA